MIPYLYGIVGVKYLVTQLTQKVLGGLLAYVLKPFQAITNNANDFIPVFFKNVNSLYIIINALFAIDELMPKNFTRD